MQRKYSLALGGFLILCLAWPQLPAGLVALLLVGAIPGTEFSIPASIMLLLYLAAAVLGARFLVNIKLAKKQAASNAKAKKAVHRRSKSKPKTYSRRSIRAKA